MDSILGSIKQLLGIPSEVDHFDVDVIMGINSALMVVNQLGVGPENPFRVTDGEQTWVDLLGENSDVESVKMYIFHKTKLGFDPPTNSFLVSSIKELIAELEWRLIVQSERIVTND